MPAGTKNALKQLKTNRTVNCFTAIRLSYYYLRAELFK